jgi:hypothetical protein
MKLKWYHNILIMVVVVGSLTALSLFFLSEYFQIIFVASSITTLLFIFVNNNREKDEINKLLDKLDKQKKEHETGDIEKDRQIQQMQKNLDVEQQRNIKLSNIVDNIGITLNNEQISTDDLIKNLKTPLRAIFFMKTSEKTKDYFRNKVYDNIHSYGIRKGVNIIPPRYIDQDKTDEEILEWFFKEIELYVPENYEYNIPFALVVNIASIGSHDSIAYEHSKSHFNWTTKVPPQDIAPPNILVKYLAGKKNISLKDIIEIPNIMFLIDELQITLADKITLEKNSNKIVNAIKKQVGSDTLKTTDLATFKEIDLMLILQENDIKDSLKVSKMLIRTANILKTVLERRFGFN